MKEPIQFYKMVASGNDFIVIDNRTKMIQDAKKFGANMCLPHIGVGADGVLLIEPSKKSDFFLRIVNADGSEAEACGNGYRCVARYAHEKLGFGRKMTFDTLAGMIQAEVRGKYVSVLMAEPRDYRRDVRLEVNGRTLKMDFINTGVPHAVIYSEGLNQIPVTELGRAIRYHEHFKPQGTNVNFIELNGSSEIRIRTYERGVEEEMLACGTGSVAAALTSALTCRAVSPVNVKTRSGETLEVSFELANGKPTKVFLNGNADYVYEGHLLM